jgi:IPT/TIG domain
VSALDGSAVHFGQSPSGRRSTPGFGTIGIVAGVVVVLLLVGTLVWVAARGNVAHARHPNVFGGSVVLDDSRALSVVDLANAAVTVRLEDVYAQVSAPSYSDIQAVPVTEGTILVNRASGTFNLLGKDDYLVDATGAGIGLGPRKGSTSAAGYADGADAYIIRYGPRSTVSLVDEATVAAGAKTQASAKTAATVTPRGFAALGGPVTDRPGTATVAAGDLWSLVGRGRDCQIVQSQPVSHGHQGLQDHTVGRAGTSCAHSVVESATGVIGVATPGQVRLFGPAATAATRPATKAGSPKETDATSGPAGQGGVLVSVPGTAGATQLLPVVSPTGGLWYLARSKTGWSVFGVSATGHVTPPHAIASLGPGAEPVPPVESAGKLYTLDRTATGQPPLLTISPATGDVQPVPGARTYPAKSKNEKAPFTDAEVLANGPRVIFNNPGSLLAVVVFTDGSHAPVTVDKSTAVDVSAVGPGDIDAKQKPQANSGAKHPTTPTTTPPRRPAQVAQPVNQRVTCANTTQTPYAPQITSITPSSGSALVAWSYQLLDEQDCEPDSWSVQVTALGGAHQPDNPVQVIDGQNQLQFAGLRPATTYKAVVTAYINAQKTPSTPVTFTTNARGPDAPTKVTTTADGNGNWVVSWTPCTSSTCYVPADRWTIIGASCGTTYVGQPPTVTTNGSTDSVTIPAGTQIGASLSFSVQGSTAAGLMGAPTFDGSCTQAWQAPNPSAITLNATGTAAGTTVTATLSVAATGAPNLAFGSSSTEFTYSVGGQTVGPTTQTSVTVTGLPGGTTFTPMVVVAPADHPTASVTINGQSFSQTVAWPPNLALRVTAGVEANANTGDVTASVVNLPLGTLTANGALTCGSVQLSLSGALTNGQLSINNLDLDTMGGQCTASLALTDTDTPNPYGAPSPTLSTTFTLGSQPAYGFTATVDPTCLTFCPPSAAIADINFQGGGQPTAGIDWTITTSGACPDVGQVSTSAPSFPYAVNLSSCADPQGATFAVSWEYLGSTQGTAAIPLSGAFGTTTTTAPPTTAPPTTTPPTTVPPTTAPPTTAPTAPAVTGVSPATGPSAGGTPVTITGTGFSADSIVNFGAAAASSVTVSSATSITAVSPGGSGTVDVAVTNSGGTSAASTADHFTYLAPTVTHIAPATGPALGATPVDLTGTGFAAGSTVDFGTTPAITVIVNSATSITAISPPGTGTVDVTVTSAGATSATSAADQFTYGSLPAVPTVSGLSPIKGTTGTLVTIIGTGFTADATVDFGSTTATGVTVVTATSVTAVAPAGTGTVDVTVTNSGGTSAASSADQFTYTAAQATVSRPLDTGTDTGPGATAATLALASSTPAGAPSLRYLLASGATFVAAGLLLSPTLLRRRSRRGARARQSRTTARRPTQGTKE